jgi:hypothetical protein
VRPNSYAVDNVYRLSRNNYNQNKSNVTLRELFSGNVNDNLNDYNIDLSNVSINILSKRKQYKIEPYQTKISIRNLSDSNNELNNNNKYLNSLNVIKEAQDYNMNVAGINPFIPKTNVSVNINNVNNVNVNVNNANLKDQNPTSGKTNNYNTSKEQFNGDENDLTKKKHQTEEELDEYEEGEGREEEFNFLSDEEVKNLNEVTSAHNLNSSSNRNYRGIGSENNNNNNIYANENIHSNNNNIIDIDDLI